MNHQVAALLLLLIGDLHLTSAAQPKNKAAILTSSHFLQASSAHKLLEADADATSQESSCARNGEFERTLDELSYKLLAHPSFIASHILNVTMFDETVARVDGASDNTTSSSRLKSAKAMLQAWLEAIQRAWKSDHGLKAHGDKAHGDKALGDKARGEEAHGEETRIDKVDSRVEQSVLPPACAGSVPVSDPYWSQRAEYWVGGTAYNVCMFSDDCTRSFTNLERITSLRNTLHATHLLLNKFGATYMLFGGTVIGSYRCEDVLPWDVDNDVAVLQDHLPRLVGLLDSETQHPPPGRGIRGRYIDLAAHGIPGFVLMEKFPGCLPLAVVDQSTGFFTDVFPMGAVGQDKIYSPWYASETDCDGTSMFGCQWKKCDAWSLPNTLPVSYCKIHNQQQTCAGNLQKFMDEYYGPGVRQPDRTVRSASAVSIERKVQFASVSNQKEKVATLSANVYYALVALVFIVPSAMWVLSVPKVVVIFTFYMGLYVAWAMLTYATRDLKYNTGMLVLNALIFKLAISLVLWRSWEGTTFKELPSIAWKARAPLLQYFVPAGLYAVSDIIRVEALQATDASSFAILFNSRMLFMAFVWQWFMNRKLHAIHWASLLAILTGCCLKEYPHIETSAGSERRQAYVFILILGVITSFATVWNEMLLQKRADVGVSLQNMAMYIWGTLFTVLLLIVWMIVDPGRLVSPFHLDSWMAVWGQPLVVLGSLILAVYGVATAYFLRYLSNITREVATGALSPMLSVALDVVLFKLVLGALEYVGLVIVASGVVLFAFKPVLAIDAAANESEKSESAKQEFSSEKHDVEKSDDTSSTFSEAPVEASSSEADQESQSSTRPPGEGTASSEAEHDETNTDRKG